MGLSLEDRARNTQRTLILMQDNEGMNNDYEQKDH
jgi:hypothetical protein